MARKMNLTEQHLRILEKESITCEDVAQVLGDYTDQDLSCSLRGRIDAHIRGCDACTELSDSYRWTVNLAHELASKPLPAGVENRLRQALNRRLGLNLPAVD